MVSSSIESSFSDHPETNDVEAKGKCETKFSPSSVGSAVQCLSVLEGWFASEKDECSMASKASKADVDANEEERYQVVVCEFEKEDSEVSLVFHDEWIACARNDERDFKTANFDCIHDQMLADPYDVVTKTRLTAGESTTLAVEVACIGPVSVRGY